MKFAWTNKFSVGVPEIDAQHKSFFEMTNGILDLFESVDADREELQLAVDELAEYAEYHFATEEKYFEKLSYPEAQNHVELHNAFREKIGEFQRKTKEVEDQQEFIKTAGEIADFAVKWMSNHILMEDKKYSELLTANVEK